MRENILSQFYEKYFTFLKIKPNISYITKLLWMIYFLDISKQVERINIYTFSLNISLIISYFDNKTIYLNMVIYILKFNLK